MPTSTKASAEAKIEVKCQTLAEVGEKIAACAQLGLRDVTVTSVPAERDIAMVTWVYYVEARDTNAREALRVVQ